MFNYSYFFCEIFLPDSRERSLGCWRLNQDLRGQSSVPCPREHTLASLPFATPREGWMRGRGQQPPFFLTFRGYLRVQVGSGEDVHSGGSLTLLRPLPW